MSDSRLAFEQAIENEHPDDYSFDFDPDGYYLDEILDRHFWAWQSSRQAIEGEPFTWAFTDVNGKAKEIADDPVHRSPQDLRIYTPLYKHPASGVPDDEYFRALQDAFDIIQADANTERNYGSLCRIGSVLGKMKAKRDKSQ